ncbi:MAG: GTPase Era [Luteibaculaceae bacterium]
MHKAGFVNIIGNPNVGKSTLMNALVGQKLAITTHKAQTTRHRIMGLVNEDDYQIIYSDTPGMLAPAYTLQEKMMNFVYAALKDADILLLVVEIGQREWNNEQVLKYIETAKVPTLLVLNKIDLANQEKLEAESLYWKEKIPQAEIIPASAIAGFNLETIKSRIAHYLPEHEPYFPKDDLSDKSVRFFVSEIVREKILMHYKKEIPYAAHVTVTDFHELENIVNIRAEILVERDTQKGIIIGHKGEKLKIVGSESRVDIEKFLEKKVFLELFVKVDKNWRTSDRKLNYYGYQG